MYQSELHIAEVTMHNRLEERRRQHDESRRARRMRLQLRAGKRYVSPALGWLGSRLVTWGSHLQERYSAAASTPQPANRLLS